MASEGGDSRPELSASRLSVDDKLAFSLMSEDEVKLSDIVCTGCLCLCRGNSDIHTHTHTHTHLRLDETIWWRTIRRLNTTLVYNHLPD